jgi:hypothetical protein
MSPALSNGVGVRIGVKQMVALGAAGMPSTEDICPSSLGPK